MKRILFLLIALSCLLDAALAQNIPAPISPLTGSEQIVIQSPCVTNIGIAGCYTTTNILKNFAGGGQVNVVPIVTTSYTLNGTEVGACLYFTAGSMVTLTIPPDSSVDFPTGASIIVVQGGAGAIGIAAGAGVTLNSFNGATVTGGQFSGASLLKISADMWYLAGTLTQ